MKPALHKSLSDLIDAARRLQHVIDGEPPDRLLAAAALGRLAGDLAAMVRRLQDHVDALCHTSPRK
jgi:hypothetical protein